MAVLADALFVTFVAHLEFSGYKAQDSQSTSKNVFSVLRYVLLAPERTALIKSPGPGNGLGGFGFRSTPDPVSLIPQLLDTRAEVRLTPLGVYHVLSGFTFFSIQETNSCFYIFPIAIDMTATEISSVSFLLKDVINSFSPVFSF